MYELITKLEKEIRYLKSKIDQLESMEDSYEVMDREIKKIMKGRENDNKQKHNS